MALEPARDPLERAREVARTSEPEHWIEISESIRGRVRSLVTPADPIVVDPDVPPSDGSTTRVSSRVVRARLRRILQGRGTHAPQAIDLTIEDERLVGIRIELVGAYGVELRPLADEVRAEVVAAVVELVGPGSGVGPDLVEIHVADVVDGDPNIT